MQPFLGSLHRRSFAALRCAALFAVCGSSSPVLWGQTQESPKSAARSSEDGVKPPAEPAEEDWSLHFQATIILQGRGAMESPYSGPHSFSANREDATSVTSTLFLGRRLWKNAA